jgi:hypothetical protein
VLVNLTADDVTFDVSADAVVLLSTSAAVEHEPAACVVVPSDAAVIVGPAGVRR